MKTKNSTVSVRIGRNLIAKVRALAKTRKQSIRVVLEELIQAGLTTCAFLAAASLLVTLSCSACSWESAAITGGAVGLALVGPPLITSQMYSRDHMAELRAKCVQASASVDDSVDCKIYFTEMTTCLSHLGLIATQNWREQCEGA